mmetsp:Transcript_116750/g.337271  ORF Transcript_116750/g.337271 Transcript_116750/m.337271 type:complete len:235 (+) Transcript_116750:981-1685(+)
MSPDAQPGRSRAPPHPRPRARWPPQRRRPSREWGCLTPAPSARCPIFAAPPLLRSTVSSCDLQASLQVGRPPRAPARCGGMCQCPPRSTKRRTRAPCTGDFHPTYGTGCHRDGRCSKAFGLLCGGCRSATARWRPRSGRRGRRTPWPNRGTGPGSSTSSPRCPTDGPSPPVRWRFPRRCAPRAAGWSSKSAPPGAATLWSCPQLAGRPSRGSGHQRRRWRRPSCAWPRASPWLP